jgi:hypothetical protein
MIGGGANNQNLPGNATRFVPMFDSLMADDEHEAANHMAFGGTVSNFRVKIDIAPTAKTRTFTVVKNGSVTAVTCTVVVASTTCADTSNSVAFAAGDTISIQSTIGVEVGTSPPATAMRWSAQYQ